MMNPNGNMSNNDTNNESNQNNNNDHHQDHYNATYANNGTGGLDRPNQSCLNKNQDNHMQQSHLNSYQLDKHYSNSGNFLNINSQVGAYDNDMHYGYANPWGEFSVHYEALTAENKALKAENAVLRKDLEEKMRKADRIDRIERELEQARISHKQLTDSFKRMEKQSNDIIQVLRSQLSSNSSQAHENERLFLKIKEQERNLQQLKNAYDEQKKHSDFLYNFTSTLQKKEQECQKTHISIEQLSKENYLLLRNLDPDRIQVLTQSQAQIRNVNQQNPTHFAHLANVKESQDPSTGTTASINHSLPTLPSSSKDVVMNSNYGTNIKATSNVDILDKDRADNIASHLSKLNLSNLDASNASYKNINGEHQLKLNETNHSERVPLSDPPLSSIVQ